MICNAPPHIRDGVFWQLIDTHPAQVVDQTLDGSGNETFAVGVVDAEQGLPAMVMGEQDLK